jgi:hypothetical protein
MRLRSATLLSASNPNLLKFVQQQTRRSTLAAGEHHLLAQKSTAAWRVKRPSMGIKGPKAKTNIRRNGEKISLFRSTVPPTFEFIAAKTDAEKVDYIQKILARSEEEALAVIMPVLRLIRSGVEVFQVYRPIIVVLRDHFSGPGRPKAGQITWAQICEQYIGVGIRRTQQLLAAPKPAPKPPRLNRGDSLALLRTTECDLAKVFGSITDAREFAEALRSFAQAVADRFGERHGKFAVSVSIQNRRKQIIRTSLSQSPISGDAAGSRNPAQLPIFSAQKPFPQDCGGCADMHLGIAKFIAKNGGTDEEAAKACGVSLAIVRQAKVRHMLLLKDSQANGHGR